MPPILKVTLSVTWCRVYTFGGYRLTEVINKNNLNGDTLIVTCTESACFMSCNTQPYLYLPHYCYLNSRIHGH